MSDPVEVLRRARTIAVVGLSRHAWKSAYSVPAAMQSAGYRVIPVNPLADEILGEKAYPTVTVIPEDIEIDVVEVFRPPEFAPEIASRAVARGTRALWLQSGIVSDEARAIAEAAGIDYVEDACMAVVRAAYQLTPAGG